MLKGCLQLVVVLFVALMLIGIFAGEEEKPMQGTAHLRERPAQKAARLEHAKQAEERAARLKKNRQAELARIAKANLSGIWALGQGKGYVYLYPNKRFKWLGENCNLIARGRWKYEHRNFHLYRNGREVLFATIISLPKNLRMGDMVRLATTREWRFLGRDVNAAC